MNLRRLSNSIVTRLILVGIAIIVIGTVIRYNLLTRFLKEDLEIVVSAQQTALASYVAQDIEHKIGERQAMLAHMAQTLPLPLLRQADALRAWLAVRHDLQPLFSQGLFVTDRHGRVLSDYPQRAERKGMSYADRDYIRDTLSGKPTIGRPVIGRVAGEPVLPMAAPITNARGEVEAILVGITPLAAPGFLDLLQKSRIGETGSFLLVSPRDQLFVAASDPRMILRPTPAPGVNSLHDRAMAGYRGSGITVNAAGIEEISAMVSVPSTGWFVVARLPTSEALATVDHVKRYILRHSIVVAIIFLVLAAIGLIVVFRPLFNAARHADRMTQGELPLEPLPVVRADEVGHLTEAFNRLLAKLQESRAELDRMAHYDILTGLPNRALLSDRMQQALTRAQRNGAKLAVLFLDLDNFKPINDSLGHQAGDLALFELARRLRSVVRATDTLARVGGDEFVILMDDLDADHQAASEVARRVADDCLKALATPLLLDGQERLIGLSLGIALGDGGSRADELLSAADTAMYEAKQAGRGKYLFADRRPGQTGGAPEFAA